MAGAVAELNPRTLRRARELLDSGRLDDTEALEISALINAIDEDIGPDPTTFPEFNPEWLRPTGPRSWVWDWRWERYVQGYLTQMRRGQLKRLILIAPVRHGKSELTTARFPVYWLEQVPTDPVIVAMHTQKLANKFSRKARRVARLKLNLSKERAAVEEWETQEGGSFRAVGVGVAVAGVGGRLIVIDDPIRSRKEAESQQYRDSMWDWYTDDIYTRLEPDGAILLTLARWHEDDLVGRILKSDDAPNWTVIHLPGIALEQDMLGRPDALGRQPGEALEPERYDREALLAIKKVMGSYGFSGLIQGIPSPTEGGILKRRWWRFHAPAEMLDRLPAPKVKMPDGTWLERPVVATPRSFPFEWESWDMAFKDAEGNDFVCGGHGGKLGADIFLTDLEKGHWDFPATIEAVKRLRDRNGKRAAVIWVEDKANGTAVIASLRKQVPGLVAVEPEGGKTARAHAAAPTIEAGNFYLPHPALVGDATTRKDNWVLEFIDSAAAFPTGAHDDDVDMVTQATKRLLAVEATPRQPGQPKFRAARAHA